MEKLLWRSILGVALCLGVGESYRRLPQEIPVPPSPPVEAPFADVAFGDRWYDGAQYGRRRGFVRGMTETEFGGELPATRAMAAAMVWRMAGEPQVLDQSRFSDVEPERYYAPAVVWGETRGLWQGYGDGSFRPDEGITWGQLGLVLDRYLGEGTAPARAEAEPYGPVKRGELAETLMELREERGG